MKTSKWIIIPIVAGKKLFSLPTDSEIQCRDILNLLEIDKYDEILIKKYKRKGDIK